MKLSVRRVLVPVIWLLWPAAAETAPAPVAPVRVGDIVAHLARSISWYRQVTAAEQSAKEAADDLVRDNAQRTSTRALQLAFDFARAIAPLVNAGQPAGGKETPASFNVEQASTRANDRVATLESQLAGVDAEIARAVTPRRANLVARRKELLAQLNLAKQIQLSVQGLRTFLSGQGAGGGADLLSYIDRLERSVPEAMGGAQAAPPPAPAPGVAAAGSPFRAESAGIFGLITEAIQMARSRRQLGDALAETEALRKNVDELRTPLVNDLRSTIQRGDAAASDSASQNAQQMDADRREIEALTARFKLMSAALLPLREQGRLIETARGSLMERRERVQQRYSISLRYLFFRVLTLVVTVAVVLTISELWRRGTFRYVRDTRRRKQFLLLRRVVVSCLIVATVLFGLMKEMGSLVTYAGFLTAGLAVALQNVILSVVAYFFLIGRYGLRVGDRVTISDVTGDVFEIGLVRIYLLEMTGGASDLHATGRVVAFSNSVVFQPAALFKQMPGTEYIWRTATLTLAPVTDLQLAESRLMAAVGAVFEQYRERIEQQHAAFQRLVDLPVPPPKPEGRLRLTNAGLEFSVRYPAELRRASATDDQVIDALNNAIAQEPRLTLASSGEPKIQGTELNGR